MGAALIEELGIRDLGVIGEATLPLGPGFTAVTGETGAGKTMVVQGLGLLFGGRADAGRVRPDAPRAVVEGRLLLQEGSAALTRAFDAGAELDDGVLLVSRTVGADGSWSVSGRPHTVLLLTLLSEVGPDDAPTRIRAGSHRDVARVLGPDALDPFVAGPIVDAASASRPVHRATGAPGDMYVLHPFTVHAADEHRGRTPRFMAQAPIMLTSPVEPGAATPLASVFD